MESKNLFAPSVEDLQPSAGPSFGIGHLPPRRLSTPRVDTSRPLVEPSPPISCVTRETFEEDCARHRFIVWAAVKRNSCTRMTAEERLECPLLRCTQRFPDHETMLRHLAGCEFLSSGEYWCYDHMRVERFDDVKCKRCLGHQSKRRKMLSMAKRFFHSLGHRQKKGPGCVLDPGDAVDPPPPSYDSLNLNTHTVIASELSATEIVELDSVEITAHTALGAGCDGAINPQALLVPDLQSAAAPADSPTFIWQLTPGLSTPQPIPTAQPEKSKLRGSVSRPSLQLNTYGLQGGRVISHPNSRSAPPCPRSKILSPSSSVRSTASTTSNASSLVSPASNWSGAFSMASGFDTTLTTPVDIGVDVAATAEGSIDLLEPNNSVISEPNSCYSETKSLIGSAWDALQEHIVSSMLKIHEIEGNALADQLRSKSAMSVVTAGLRTLRSLLCEDNKPVTAIDTLCFVHLVYAFSLAIHEQDTAHRARDLFLQSLSYADRLSPGERDLYTRLTCEIWQPANISQGHIGGHCSGDQNVALYQSPVLKGTGPEATTPYCERAGTDALLIAALDFLDELESSIILGEPASSLPIQTLGLYTEHMLNRNSQVGVNIPFAATVNFVTAMLLEEFSDVEDLLPKLSGLQNRVQSGIISSVRRFELELLNAGKGCMSNAVFFDRFVPEVRKLCDQIYKQHDSGASRRMDYHSLGISLIESIIPEFDSTKADSSILDDVRDLNDLLLDEFPATYDLNQDETYAAMELLPALPFNTIHPQGLGGMGSERLQVPTVTTTAPESPPNRDSSPATEPAQPKAEQATQQHGQPVKVEADTSCDICGYRPKGNPQWFKCSMSKHRRMQHSGEPPKIYKCPFPGCTSQYRNRPDNLRQHQIEKNHFIDEEVPSWRPNKRKKKTEDD